MKEEDDEMDLRRRVWTLTDAELGTSSSNEIVKSLHKLISQSEYFSLKNFISDKQLWDSTLDEVKQQLIDSIEND